MIDPPSLRAVVVAEAELGERIMRALILRRMGIDRNRRRRPDIDWSPRRRRAWCGCRDFFQGTAILILALDPVLDSVAEDLMKLHATASERIAAGRLPGWNGPQVSHRKGTCASPRLVYRTER